MSTVENLRKICQILDANKIEYVIVGGIAAILLGIQRTTLDIDIIINLTTEDEIKKLVEVLKAEGYNVSLYEALEAFKEKTHFTAIFKEGGIIDFKYVKSNLDILTLKRKIFMEILGIRIPISPLEELITAKLKILGSQKDVEDALQLMYIYVDKINWKLLNSYIGENPLKYTNKIISTIMKEFPDEKQIINKIKNLEELKNKIENILSKTKTRSSQ